MSDSSSKILKLAIIISIMFSSNTLYAQTTPDELADSDNKTLEAVNVTAFDEALNDIRKSVKDAQDSSGGARFAIYEFGRSFPAPIQGKDGKKYTKSFSVNKWSNTLIIIPQANGRPQTSPYKAVNRTLDAVIYYDSHEGPDSRCEKKGLTDALGNKLPAELIQAPAIFDALDKPDILINTNFFDVVAQGGDKDGWKKSLCSATYGPYTDTRPRSSSYGAAAANREYTKNSLLASDAKQYYPDNLTQAYQQSTLFLAETSRPDKDGTIEFRTAPSIARQKIDGQPLIDVRLPTAADVAYGYDRDSRSYVAFSGASLYDDPKDYDPPLYTPGANKATTRTAVGYNDERREFYIFQGGDYSKNGWTLTELAGLFRALGVKSTAVNLDGGGSSTIFINKDAYANWYGAGDNAMKRCLDSSGAYCSLPTQSDGKYRANPAWAGFRVNLNSTLQ